MLRERDRDVELDFFDSSVWGDCLAVFGGYEKYSMKLREVQNLEKCEAFLAEEIELIYELPRLEKGINYSLFL
jgi:hypothetical protein